MLSRRSFQSLRCVVVVIVIIFIVGCLLAIRKISKEESRTDDDFKKRQTVFKNELKVDVPGNPKRVNQTKQQLPIPKLAEKQAPRMLDSVRFNRADDSQGFPPPNYNVHAFYYMWYGNPTFDGRYLHWNHQKLPHWDKRVAKKFATNQHVPPDDIGAGFYPELGCYSSRNPAVMENHVQQMRAAGIGVIVLSWYPPNKSDEAGFPNDDLVPILLDTCHKYDVKLAFHSEPYKNRTELTFLDDLKYIIKKYGTHPAFYRRRHKGADLPLVYLYDSYLTPSRSWARVLKKNTPLSIRGKPHDAVIVGLYVEQKHNADLLQGGFDGFYTYFASNKFTFASRWTNWALLAQMAARNSMIFIPSVGPGYDDTTVRPWNSQNTRERLNGKYYTDAFEAAMNHTPPVISITSFNEWHEGTQIERAVSKGVGRTRYHDYQPYDPGYYLDLTRQMVEKFANYKG